MTKKKEKTLGAVYRKPKRIFEKSGTVYPDTSYYVPLENVVNADKQDMKTMVDSGRYFSIFAPRQSGKTTFLRHLTAELHRDNTYVILLLSFQKYARLDKETFYARIQKKLYSQLIDRLTMVNCDKLDAVKDLLDSHHLTDHLSFGDLFEELNRVIQLKKLVIFIDEFDGIPRDELENFLTALRDLYLDYKDVKQKALYSIGLIGIRNVTKLVVGGSSPFNIADQVSLTPFSLKNVRDLYAQYSEETNQPFTGGAVKAIYEETSGQPWLVNRLGSLLTLDVKPGTVEPIDKRDVKKALQILQVERNDHFDNLYEKAKLYKETFVEIVFDHVEYNPYNEEQSWLEQYGLIKNRNGHAVVTNNIYKSIHIKAFFKEIQADKDISLQAYVLPGNRLDMNRIFHNFDRYIAQIGVRAFYSEEKPYEKTGQFLLTAWLYQFVKSGEGELRYELVSGLGRLDVLLTYRGKKYIIETKVNRRKDAKGIIKEGLLQLTEKYMATEGEVEGYLVVFDTGKPVGDACQTQTHPAGNKSVTSFTIAIGKVNGQSPELAAD